MAWTLIPCLVSLRAEFDTLAPDRDKASDGSIGDGEHSQNTSDHNPDETGKTPSEDPDSTNEVHAIDVDTDLRQPGWTMERAVQIIVTRHRNGLDDRLQNVIYNRRIWSRSWGWTQRGYDGANPHDKHAHFSARYTTAEERDTRPWGLLEADVALSDADKVWISAQLKATPAAVWNDVSFGRDENRRTAGQILVETRTHSAYAAGAIDSLDVQMDTYATADAVRDAQLLAELNPEAIAAAIPDGVAQQVADILAARLQS